MHGLTLFDEADATTSSCNAIIEGKEMPDHRGAEASKVTCR
ncbi:MAG: hypothetical protein JWO94_2464 [Verrucomicrobiaceae bacterium]|nr:hypothetical protein [Verrucomicrobiaceae bacterium]